MADVIETIGASGETYATISAWLSAHNAKGMVALGNRYIGRLVDEVYEVDAGVLEALNTGTRSASFYRMLVGSTGQSNALTATVSPPTGGNYTLTVNGQTTATIAHNAAASAIQAALEALSNVAVGDVVVTATPAGSTLAVAGTVMRIDWKLALGGQVVTVSANFGGLTGGSGSSSVALSITRVGAEGYKPERHTGPRVYVRWTGTGDQAGLRIDAAETFFRAQGFALIGEDPLEVSAGNKRLLHVQGDSFVGSRLFARISDGGARASATGAIFTCYYVNNVTGGNNADQAVFLNCFAYGSRFYKGAHEGFWFDNFASNGGCYNCAAYSIRHVNTGAGFRNLSGSTVKPRLVNCVALDCGVGVSGTWESIALDPLAVDSPYSCIVSDGSTPFGTPTDTHLNNVRFADARSIFGRADVQDLRPNAGSAAFGAIPDAAEQPPRFRRGRDMSLIWTALGLTPDDFDGVARSAASGGYLDDSNGWTIGPYHSAGSQLATTPPATEVKSIGSASGRDYATIQAFLDATDDQSLIYQNKVVVGELYADSDFSITAGQRVVARRTIADSRHYRTIRPAAGSAFDPLTGIGARIKGDGGAVSGENNLVEVHEDHFRITGPLIVEQTFSGAADRRALKLQADYLIVSGVYGKFIAGTSSFSSVFLIRGSRALVHSCIAAGSNTANVGANYGFLVQNCETTHVACCTAWGLDGASGRGFVEGASTSRVEITSCAAADCVLDFAHTVGANAPRVQSHNVSSDSTADGPGSQRTVASATLFRSAATGDFRNLAGSAAIKRGKNLSARFSTDFLGAQRFAPFDVGAYEGLPAGALFRAPDFIESRAFQTLWEIVRPDGVAFLFTDQPEPVVYRGRTYEAGGSLVASNRRAESSAHTVGVQSSFRSDKITVADLAGGKFRGARIRETLLGRYAWTQPIEENVYILGQVEFDADVWPTEFTSLASLLDKNAGRLITVNCPLRLGDTECLVDLAPNTVDDVRVSATIQDSRRKFNAELIDISAGFADDYFAKGELVWLSGANAGVSCQVKSYTAAARTVELEEALPANVAQNDTFQMLPGCRKRYLLDCITKHSNGINNGGEPFMPGTDKSLSTPTR